MVGVVLNRQFLEAFYRKNNWLNAYAITVLYLVEQILSQYAVTKRSIISSAGHVFSIFGSADFTEPFFVSTLMVAEDNTVGYLLQTLRNTASSLEHDGNLIGSVSVHLKILTLLKKDELDKVDNQAREAAAVDAVQM
jgi:hypothetical protein